MTAERPVRNGRPVGRQAMGPALLALSPAAGVVAGAAAQLLATGGEAVRPLGTSLAPWLTIGFVLAILTARSWRGPNRASWTCVLAASYLYAWLLTYHVLYRVIQHPPTVAVWAEARLWVAAVAPGCVALGVLALGSLRRGLVGDACSAAALAWSVPEIVAAAQTTWSHAALFALPVLALAAVPPAVARGRRCDAAVVVATALLGGAALMVALPPLLHVLNGYG